MKDRVTPPRRGTIPSPAKASPRPPMLFAHRPLLSGTNPMAQARVATYLEQIIRLHEGMRDTAHGPFEWLLENETLNLLRMLRNRLLGPPPPPAADA